MLTRLSIQNFAIIDEATINFSNRLSIITGETGAGKSILLGGLSLILGERAEATSFFDKEKKCVVEAEFDIKDLELDSFFETEGLDFEEHTLVRREINPGGKSRAFINDTPVNLQTLKKLTAQLVNLHQQHDTLELNDATFQLKLIDSISGSKDLLKKYQLRFRSFREIEKNIRELKDQLDKASREQDYILFQFNELKEASLNEGEQENIEQEMNALVHAEEIKRNLSTASAQLQNNEGNISDELRSVLQLLQSTVKFQPDLEELANRLKSATIEVKDIAAELENREIKLQFSPERLLELQNRLDIIYRLQKKHRANSISELLQLQNQFDQQLLSMQTDSTKLDELTNESVLMKKELKEIAQSLSKKRLSIISPAEKEVNNLLKEASMPFAQIKFEHKLKPENDFSENGIDQFRLLFASNKGSDFIELNKVASGGELSRLMLCLQSLVAESVAMPTLIFDEIDTGVSGEAARKVSILLQKLSSKHQVICITHLPQIAGKGEKHFFVYKENLKSRTFTRVRELKTDERIIEIARMLSGEKPTEAAMRNAKELMEN
ncbi:DNA repair protein RecN [Bacteroidota bacterium]|nr:DNA repair protein RecN [Bacteroidota bacterium]